MDVRLRYVHTDSLLDDSKVIIESARNRAYIAINTAMVERNWLLGKRIAEEELNGKNRAEYGSETIKCLARELTAIYGKGFDYSSLYKYLRFYKVFPDILDSVSTKSALL